MSHPQLLKTLLPPASYDHAGRIVAAQLGAEGAALDTALAAAARVVAAITPDGDTELLQDWERVYGLPDSCLTDIDSSVSTRIAAALEKIRAGGGISRETVLRVMASAGAFNLPCGSPVFGLLNAAVSTAQSAAPDGTPTADLIVPTTDLANHRINKTVSGLGSLAGPLTWSIYVKAAGYTRVRLQILSSPTTSTLGSFDVDLTTGQVKISTFGGGAVGNLDVDDAGDGWYRLILTATLGGTDQAVICRLLVMSGTTVTFSGDGVSGVYAWGPVLNWGATPSAHPAMIAAGLAAGPFVAASNLLSTVGIEEYSPLTVASPVGYPIYDIDSQYYWKAILLAGTPPRPFSVLDSVTTPLVVYQAGLLECLLNKLKPAHTQLLFSYV